MCAELPTVLITIALNVLKKAGVHRSLVFSPISILLSLWKPDSADPILGGVASLNQTFWSENRDFMLANRVESYTLDWTLPINESRTRPFQINGTNSEHLKFVMMNKEENKYLSCEKSSAKRASDAYFEVLEIPLYNGRRFVSFLPQNNAPLSENLKELDTTRFHDLLNKLSDEFIHFETSSFKLHSNISTTEVLGSRIDVHHKFRFEIPTRKLHSNISNTEMCRNVQYKSPTVPMRQEPNPRFVLRVCETIPYCLELNRPFLFSVLNGDIPMVMGIFNGLEN